MIFSIIKRKGNSLFPVVVPALNAVFALVLLFFFEEGIYSSYVYITASITVTFLLCNLGLRLSLVKLNDCFSNFEALKRIKKVLVVFVLLALIYSISCSLLKGENVIILLVFGALNLLLMDAFLAFNNSKGKIALGYIRFAIGPRVVFFVIFLITVSLGLSLDKVYFFSIISSLIAMLMAIFAESNGTLKSVERDALPYSKPFKMFAEWSQIALYGLFTPGLIVYAEHFDSDMVKVLGIVLMIGQPFTILYQGSIALKLKQLKEIATNARSTEPDITAYQLVTKVGVIGAVLHLSLVVVGYLVFFHYDTKILFQNNYTAVALVTFSTLYVNAVFGPNGTVLGLLGRSYFDAYVALSKITCVVVVAFVSNSILLMLITALITEFIGNVIKNLYLGRLVGQNKLFTLKPTAQSFSILVINFYVCF